MYFIKIIYTFINKNMYTHYDSHKNIFLNHVINKKNHYYYFYSVPTTPPENICTPRHALSVPTTSLREQTLFTKFFHDILVVHNILVYVPHDMTSQSPRHPPRKRVSSTTCFHDIDFTHDMLTQSPRHPPEKGCPPRHASTTSLSPTTC